MSHAQRPTTTPAAARPTDAPERESRLRRWRAKWEALDSRVPEVTTAELHRLDAELGDREPAVRHLVAHALHARRDGRFAWPFFFATLGAMVTLIVVQVAVAAASTGLGSPMGLTDLGTRLVALSGAALGLLHGILENARDRRRGIA